MKIDGRITIYVSDEGAHIQIEDREANTTFCDIKMTPKQFTTAIGRQVNVKVESMEIRGLSKVGKKHENKTFEFSLCVEDVPYTGREVLAKKVVKDKCPEGWIPDNYFKSQDSFFKRDGIAWARCTIRRYV